MSGTNFVPFFTRGTKIVCVFFQTAASFININSVGTNNFWNKIFFSGTNFVSVAQNIIIVFKQPLTGTKNFFRHKFRVF